MQVQLSPSLLQVLDALFPSGQRSRRLVSLFFRLALHPGEWPRALWAAACVLAALAAHPFLLCARACGKLLDPQGAVRQALGAVLDLAAWPFQVLAAVCARLSAVRPARARRKAA